MKKVSSDNDVVYFKGAKITKTESKRVIIALGFGVVGVAFAFLIGTDSSRGGKGIVLAFAVAGYLVGVRALPKSTH